MAQRPSPRGEPSGVPVVLCCALGEEAEVEEAGRVLRERGIAVEVLVGVELDPRALATAIDRWRGEGLYVLCRAGSLDRMRIDALREVLLARRVPFGRTLTVGSTTRAELLERIEQGLKKVVPTARASSASLPAAAPASTGESSGSVRPRRQTIPVIPASVTRTLQGGPRPAPAKPASPQPSAGTHAPAVARSVEPTQTAPIVPSAAAVPIGEVATANEETSASSAAQEETSTSGAPHEVTTTHEPALGPDPEPTLASVNPLADPFTADPEDITFAGATEEPAPSEAAAEPTQTKRPDTSVTAMELDADLMEDDDEITRLRPKREDEELPSLDLDGMLAGIGDGPDPAARGNTVIARADTAAPRGDTVIARSDTALPRGLTQRAPALPFDGYPDDASELSLSDGEVLVDRTMVTPAQRPPPPPLALTTTVPTPRSAPPAVEDEPSSGGGKLLVAAVIGALGLGVLVAVIVSNRDGKETTASVDSAKTEAVETSKSPTSSDAAKPDTAKPLDADSEVEPKAEDPKSVLDPKSGALATADAKAEAVRDPDATRPGLANATVKPAAKLPTTARPPAVPPPPKTRVQAALRAREVRALDILLVIRKPSRPLAFADAERHCSSLDVRGIQGWRLPDVGELASLGGAGMLSRGVYWSSTSGDTFGDTHMAWNGRTGQAARRTKGAVALCVRGDRGEAQ